VEEVYFWLFMPEVSERQDTMGQHKRFKIADLEQLKAEIAALNLDIPIADDVGVLSDVVPLKTCDSPNRFVVQPMEGFDATPAGTPQELSFRRYRRYAEGGAGLIWFEATSVVPEGRSNPAQFWMNEGNVDTYAELVAQTKKTGRDAMGHEPVCVLQMTHSGRYSKPTGTPDPLIAHHSEVLDPVHGLPGDYPLVTDDYLDRLQDAFVNAAGLAQAAGFDGVDVKSCHRYLVAELHASFTRDGKYGGSLENRTRMLRETLAKIGETHPGLLLTTRLNCYDAVRYPYGFAVNRDDYTVPDLSEPLTLIDWLEEIGIGLLNVSIGNPYFNPHYNRPYDFPIKGVEAPSEHPLVGVERVLQVTRQIQEANPELPIVGSAYAWVRQFMPHVASAVVQRGWATLIGQGRGSFAYPDSVKDILTTGRMDPEKCCVTCSACTQIMRDGGQTGCVVRDSELYGPKYREARRFSIDRLKEEAARCRDCDHPTCSQGCPAKIDIPAFIRAFADEDIAGAYAILKKRNTLPEMCGSICPVGVQCEAHCLENIFCENPIPIQDIQLVVSRLARLKGLTGVEVPSEQNGKRVAIVGAGPAGIACAAKLLETGHAVTIIDKSATLGGTPDATIPAERFGRAESEVEAILRPALDNGCAEVRLNTALGRDVSLSDLQNEHDAVFLSIGLTQSTSIGKADGVVGALEFLRAAKAGKVTDIPPRVAVLGAGNTAMDAGVTAVALGARDVYIVYRRSFSEMPAWKRERDAFLDAGGHVLLLTQPLGYTTEDGRLTALKCARTTLGEPDSSGRRRPIQIPDSEYSLEVDLVVEAMGQALAEGVKAAIPTEACTERGLLKVTAASFATPIPGLFAAGDIVNGGTTAVQGVVEGMAAADGIAAYLED